MKPENQSNVDLHTHSTHASCRNTLNTPLTAIEKKKMKKTSQDDPTGI